MYKGSNKVVVVAVVFWGRSWGQHLKLESSIMGVDTEHTSFVNVLSIIYDQ